MKTLACTVALALAVALSACGSGDETSSSPTGTATTPAEKEIAGVIAKFEMATKDHNANTFCTEVISTAKDSPYGQDPKTCALIIGKVMKDPTSALSSEYKIEVQSYNVDGKVAKVETQANGKAKTLVFTDDDNGWRLTSFGGGFG